jgi:hypothetical protein
MDKISNCPSDHTKDLMHGVTDPAQPATGKSNPHVDGHTGSTARLRQPPRAAPARASPIPRGLARAMRKRRRIRSASPIPRGLDLFPSIPTSHSVKDTLSIFSYSKYALRDGAKQRDEPRAAWDISPPTCTSTRPTRRTSPRLASRVLQARDAANALFRQEAYRLRVFRTHCACSRSVLQALFIGVLLSFTIL